MLRFFKISEELIFDWRLTTSTWNSRQVTYSCLKFTYSLTYFSFLSDKRWAQWEQISSATVVYFFITFVFFLFWGKMLESWRNEICGDLECFWGWASKNVESVGLGCSLLTGNSAAELTALHTATCLTQVLACILSV